MKGLLKIFEKVRPNFEEGGKLGAFKPLYEAMENFFFAPSTRTGMSPHIRDPLDVKRYMTMVIIAVMPCLLAAYYYFGLRLFAMIIVSYAAGGIVEVAFAMIRKEDIAEGFLVTGMIFPLVLPPTLPLWMVGVGVAFGVFVGKELFGGTGRNVFNPAIVGRCFLALAYPGAMTKWTVPGSGAGGRMMEYVTDVVTTATPLAAKPGDMPELSQMFLGGTLGSIGETSAIAIIAGGIFLCLTRVANWRTVAGILISAAVLVGCFYSEPGSILEPVLWQLCAGGLLLGAFFMATDPVTSPITNSGKWMYGILIGAITILIRKFAGTDEGMMFAILIGNICAPIIDEAVFNIRLRRLANEG